MNRPVKISFALNGFVAEVGCQTLVYNDRSALLNDLSSYLDNPEATEKRFRETAINTKVTLGDQPQPAGCYQTPPPLEVYPTEATTPARGQGAGNALCQRG